MKEYQKRFQLLFNEINKVVVGQREMIEQILIAILCDSNVLLEGNPGLAKTLTINTLSNLIDLKFSRIQFTPDLMPSDITGTYIIEEINGKREFKFQFGPVFANIVLADEINRATPKTQSALLEAMQERQITVGNKTFKLERPFFVMATQNPIEQEGTYPLPEAQADRFLLKINLDYPSEEEELKILNLYSENKKEKEQKIVFTKKSIIALQSLTKQVPIANDLKKKIVKIVSLTRNLPELIEYGASPRATIGLALASKAKALIEGRSYVSSKDIEEMAYPVLRHRIILNFEAERRGMDKDDAIETILSKVK